MSEYAALCQFPSAAPPDGWTVNFIDPPTYAPTVIAISTLMMALALVFTAGRLFANRRALAWSDYLNLIALVCSLAQGGLMLAQLRYARHLWDIPACWFFGDYGKILLSQQMVLLPGLFFSKASLFFLLLQIFNIKGGMRIAIYVGLLVNFLLYFTGIPVTAYYGTPDIGHTWESFILSGKQRKAIYWGLVQSAVAIVLDVYMWVLPLPVVAQLRIPSKKQTKLGAIFSTAFMGVIANILSLVYRVLEYEDTADGSWNLYALLTCTVVELNVAIIVCSVPGFYKFTKTYLPEWTGFASLWSRISSTKTASNGSGSSEKNSNWPRESQDARAVAEPSDDLDTHGSHCSAARSMMTLPLDSLIDVNGSVELDRWCSHDTGLEQSHLSGGIADRV